MSVKSTKPRKTAGNFNFTFTIKRRRHGFPWLWCWKVNPSRPSSDAKVEKEYFLNVNISFKRKREPQDVENQEELSQNTLSQDASSQDASSQDISSQNISPQNTIPNPISKKRRRSGQRISQLDATQAAIELSELRPEMDGTPAPQCVEDTSRSFKKRATMRLNRPMEADYSVISELPVLIIDPDENIQENIYKSQSSGEPPEGEQPIMGRGHNISDSELSDEEIVMQPTQNMGSSYLASISHSLRASPRDDHNEGGGSDIPIPPLIPLLLLKVVYSEVAGFVALAPEYTATKRRGFTVYRPWKLNGLPSATGSASGSASTRLPPSLWNYVDWLKSNQHLLKVGLKIGRQSHT